MGTVSLYTFVAGSVPTASQWNQNPVAIAAVINGEIDEANIQTADSDGVVGMSVVQTTGNSNPITGNKSFSGTVDVNVPTFISGFDAIVDGTTATYTTVQAADDALDNIPGYRIFVNGSQTYAETITLSTNDNYIEFGPLCVVTSLVLSGDRNTVVMGTNCQFTGAVTLSGAQNKLHMGAQADLDGAVLISGGQSDVEFGPNPDFNTTLAISGADSVVKVGPSVIIGGAVTLTGDDVELYIGQGGALSSTLSLDTATGQVFRAGSETQIGGNITVSSADAELHMGSTANLDGDFTLSGIGAKVILGVSSNLATTKTMLLSGANATCIVGAQATWPGIISMTADDTYLELGNQSIVTGATGLITGSGQVLKVGNECQFIGNITQSANDSKITFGTTANIDGEVAISGGDAKMEVGDRSNLASTLGLLTNAGTGFKCGNTTQIVDDITVSGASAVFEAAPNWDFVEIINITSAGDQCKMTLGANGNLAGAFTIAGSESDVYIGSKSTIAGATTLSGISSLLEGGQFITFSSTIAQSGTYSRIEMGNKWTPAGAITVSGTACKLRSQNQSTIGATLTVSGPACVIDIGTDCDFNDGTTAISVTGAADEGSFKIGPRGLIDAAVAIAADDFTLNGAGGCDFGGIVTLSGAGCSLICENGCDFDGLVLTGDKFFVDGGGLDTLVNGTTANHAVSISSGNNGIIQDMTVSTTAGGSAEYAGIVVASGSDLHTIQNVYVNGSDDYGMHIVGDHCSILFCVFAGTQDDHMLLMGGDRGRIIGNRFASGGLAETIVTDAECDKTVIMGNLGEDSAGTFTLAGGANSSVMVGNTTNIAVVNSSTNSQMSLNALF